MATKRKWELKLKEARDLVNLLELRKSTLYKLILLIVEKQIGFFIGSELKPLPHMLALTNLILHDIEVPEIVYDDALSREMTSITGKDRVDCILANPPFGGTVSDGMETNFPTNFRRTRSRLL